jgi:hypothetical protein
MGHEKSDPKIGIIAKVAVIGIVSVVGTRQALISYFGYMNDREHYTKWAMQKPEELMKLREDEAKRLNAGPMPIASSMKMLVEDKGRVPGLEPKAADPMREKDTMAGWAQMPRQAPSAEPAPSAPAPSSSAPAPAPSASASAAASAVPAPSGSAPAPSASAQHGEHH